MATKERVTNRSADKAKHFGALTGVGYLCLDPINSYYIFSAYDSISTWYNVDDTKAAG